MNDPDLGPPGERSTVHISFHGLERILGRPAKIAFVDQRSGQFQGRLISSEKALGRLGWKPEHAYGQALERYARAYAAGGACGGRSAGEDSFSRV